MNHSNLPVIARTGQFAVKVHVTSFATYYMEKKAC